ncbi:protein-tyrosine phosphatase-like protein [Blastocladiella britannica]|nr:protein-tyrosine phosphatase-like protein [Blastocladiella britannica]
MSNPSISASLSSTVPASSAATPGPSLSRPASRNNLIAGPTTPIPSGSRAVESATPGSLRTRSQSRSASPSMSSTLGVTAQPAASATAVPSIALPAVAPPGVQGKPVAPLFKAMSLIEHKGLRFIVMDAPSESNLAQYARELVKNGVTDVVRACEPTYSAAAMAQFNITVHELNFKDGDPPPATIVSQWLTLVSAKFCSAQATEGTIAVHCVAGLGRAPVLVAIAMIEAGMANLDAVEFIRSRRRGALNVRQVQFLDSYKRKGKGRLASAGAATGGNPAPSIASSAGGASGAATAAAGGVGAGGGGSPAKAGKDHDKCTVM